jgi:DNA-binding MarR family transcriptional regulator
MPKNEADITACRACLCLASRRASRAITRAFDRRLRPQGIRATQFSILVALIERGPSTIGELAEELGIERTTLSRNLDLILNQDWVKIEIGSEDARSRNVAITRAGRRAVVAALPAWREAQTAAIAALGSAGSDAVRSLAGMQIA